MQADLDIELQRNKFYSAKKKIASDFLIGRAARIMTLLAEARHEVVSLKAVHSMLQGLTDQIAAVKDGIDVRYQTLHFGSHALLQLDLLSSPLKSNAEPGDLAWDCTVRLSIPSIK